MAEFVAQISKISSEKEFQQLANSYGLSRKNPKFWAEFDKLHEHKASAGSGNDPVRQGIIDLEYYLVF